jgi:MOSC domain-containing protein YiiM
VGADGCEGDAQRDQVHHGGPERAVMIYSLGLIEALQREGHPIQPGWIGENLTIAGLDWSAVRTGAVLQAGDVVLEVRLAASPCAKIAGAFADGLFKRVSEKIYPGWSRWGCRVLHEGELSAGLPIEMK